MKTILSTTAAFLIAGAVGGYWYEAVKLRQTHAQGFALALTDFTFEAIYATVFSMVGCFTGLAIGLALNWFFGRSTPQPVNH